MGRTQFDKSRSSDSIRMTLFSAAFLASGALASDRTFADKPDFMLAVSEGWNPTWAANEIRMIEDNTALYFDTYVPSDNNKGQRVAKIMAEFLAGTRVGAKKLSQKCNDGRRKRSVNDDDTRYNVPVNNPQHAMFQLFYQHAEWVRNEIFTSDKRNCKKQALRLFKRLDRHQQYWAWQFCSKIDATPQFCEWAYSKKNGETKGHPRKGTYVSDKYGRDVDTAYTAVGCKHARDGDDHAKLLCPTGNIKILEATLGRDGKGICSSSGNPAVKNKCDEKNDVFTMVEKSCAGLPECYIDVSNYSLYYDGPEVCADIPK